MKASVNGNTYHIDDADGLRSLLEVLREELGITGPKAGCNEGSCGTCTVLVNGEPSRACLIPVAAVGETEITTVEGLGSAADPHPVQRAFQERYAAQCGYCTPGMIMATVALLERCGEPSDADIEDALDGHVCRCTGYLKIIDAIRASAGGRVSERATVRSA